MPAVVGMVRARSGARAPRRARTTAWGTRQARLIPREPGERANPSKQKKKGAASATTGSFLRSALLRLACVCNAQPPARARSAGAA